MIVREAFLLIVVPVFLFSLWVGWNDKDYDKHYHIKNIERPAKVLYIDGALTKQSGKDEYVRDRDYWHLPEVQKWAKHLADIKFPNAEKQQVFGIWQIKLEGKWHAIACSAKGIYLYVGWKPTEKQKEYYFENRDDYRDCRNTKERHLVSIQENPKRL